MIWFPQYPEPRSSPDPRDDAPELFTKRKLDHVSVLWLYSWIQDNRIPSPVRPEDLHATVIAARNIPEGYRPDKRPVRLRPESFHISVLGPALALRFECEELEAQWLKAKQGGAEMKFQNFIPHISLTYRMPSDYAWWTLAPPRVLLTLEAEEADIFNTGFALAA